MDLPVNKLGLSQNFKHTCHVQYPFCSKCHVHVWNQQTFNASQDCQVHYLIPGTCIYFNVTFILITEAEKKNDEANNL